jgi:hypothetical protein
VALLRRNRDTFRPNILCIQRYGVLVRPSRQLELQFWLWPLLIVERPRALDLGDDVNRVRGPRLCGMTRTAKACNGRRIEKGRPDPKTSAEWKALVDRLADETVLFLPNRRLPHLEISAPSWLQMPETPLR